jgi:hypothetical protein
MICLPKNVYRIPSIPDCLSTLRIKTTLISGNDDDKKVFRLRAPNGKVYVLRKKTNNQGEITLQLRGNESDLPAKLMNPWAGVFVLFVDDFLYRDCEGKTYPGVQFRVADTLDSETDYLIDLTDCAYNGQAEYSSSDFSDEYNI